MNKRMFVAINSVGPISFLLVLSIYKVTDIDAQGAIILLPLLILIWTFPFIAVTYNAFILQKFLSFQTSSKILYVTFSLLNIGYIITVIFF